MWIALTVLCAFFTATVASVSKVILKRNDEYLIGWLRSAIGAAFLLPVIFFIKIPSLDAVFFETLLIMLPLELAGYLLFIKALKQSPLSLTLPFLSFTPVFMILSGYFILHESFTPTGVYGISLVAIGAYLLNIQDIRMGILGPIRSIFRERGSVYMLITSFIYSITAALGKLAIMHSSPMFLSSIYYILLAVMLLPVPLLRYRKGLLELKIAKRDRWLLLLLGPLFFFSVITHFSAISMSNAAYMIAIKRLSVIFGVIYGWLIFKEKYIINRLTGTAIMIMGVLLISLA